MRVLTWTDKMLIQKMVLETLERVFDKDMAYEVYLAYSEAVFRTVEDSKWFQDNKPILIEYIAQILGALVIDCAKFMFEGEQE